MALKLIMLLFQKFQKWKSEKSYMEKFTGQRKQLNYLCLYEQSILNIYKVLVFFFFFSFPSLYIFRPEYKSERISITIATKIQPCIYTPQRIVIFILVSKNQQYLTWI